MYLNFALLALPFGNDSDKLVENMFEGLGFYWSNVLAREIFALNQRRIDLCHKPFRSGSHHCKGNGGKKENDAYQDAEAAPDEGIRTFGGEDTAGIAWLFAYKGDESESGKSKRQDHETQAGC